MAGPLVAWRFVRLRQLLRRASLWLRIDVWMRAMLCDRLRQCVRRWVLRSTQRRMRVAMERPLRLFRLRL
ncbi:MAG: hypothetical protein WD851_03005 [Pirellulales bacterium]